MPEQETDIQGLVNLQQMAELEYCLQKYYNENFAPVVSAVRKDLEAKKRTEAGQYWLEGHSPYLEPSIADHTAIHKMEWNSKDSEYVVQESQRRLNESSSVNHDLGKFVSVYQSVLLRDLGEQRYKELSKSLDCDLAIYYVGQRLFDMNLHQLARYELPLKNSLFVQSMERSLLGLCKILTTQSMSGTEASVHDVADRLHDPSFGEQLKYELGAMAVDTGLYALATGSVGLGAIGWDLVARVSILGFQNSTQTDSEKNEEAQSQVVFNNTAMQKRIIDASKKVKSSQSLFVHSLNKELNNKMKIQAYNPVISNERIKATQLQLLKEYAGKDKGESFLRFYSDIQTLGYGAYDDDRWDSAIGNIIGEPEPWMLKQDEKTLMNNATWWGSLYYNMVNLRKDEQNVNGKKMSRRDVLVKAFHYTEALYRVQHGHASSYYSEEQQKESSREVTAEEFFHMKESQTYKPDTNRESTDSTSDTPADEAMNKQTNNPLSASSNQQQYPNTIQAMNMALAQQPSMMPHTDNLGSWGSLFDTFGLSNFGTVGRNFGQVLARLPEIMIGMFTGKLSNLKVRDNLLPLASIMIGLFLPARTNPFLKFLFLGLGGLNLLNKAGQTVLNVNQATVRTYRKYDDEPLNSRISKPVVKGSTLLADIDGNPLVLKLSDNAVDAFNKGFLPLNTLANAVLSNWDERQKAISHNYDSRISLNESINKTHDLRI